MKQPLLFPLAVVCASILHAADLPLLIAHRGASQAAPENTLAAFKLAWEEGADGIEGDFHLTADGEVVCIHDDDTKRVAGKKLVVAQSPWSDLAGLDVGSWKSPAFKDERIPRLGDVLAALPPGKRFFLEVKDSPAIVGPIQRIFAEKKADPSRVVIISFDAAVIAACREKMPAFQAHWISDLKDFKKADKREGYVRQLQACGAQGLQFKATSPVEAAWLGERRKDGLLLTSWTVDDAALARKMIGLGVHHITTNRPALLRKELTE